MRNSIPCCDNSALLYHLTKDAVSYDLVNVIEELFLGGVIIRFKLIIYVEEDVGGYQAAYSL